MSFILRLVGFFLIDRLDFEQSKEAFLFFGGPNLAGDEIAGLKIEAANLRGRYVDIFGTRQIVEALRAEKAKALRQHLEDTLGEQDASAFGIFLKDVENDLMFAHCAEILDVQIASHLIELGHGHRLELGNVQRSGGDFVFIFGGLAIGFVLLLLNGFGRLDLLFWRLRLGRWLSDSDIRNGNAIVITVCLIACGQFRALGFRLFRTGSWHSSI